MKKILILCLGFLLTLSVLGKNREHMNPAIMDAMITNYILDELREAGYTVLPEVVVVAYRNDQDTIKKDFRHQRGLAFQNDTLKKEFGRFQGKEFQGRMGRPEFGRFQGREFQGRPEFQKQFEMKKEFRGRPEFGRPEFGRRGEMKGRGMKRGPEMKDCPCLKQKLITEPIKPPVS